MSEREQARVLEAAGSGRCPACGQPRPDLATPCPHCGAPALGPAEVAASRDADERRAGWDALMQVRASDVEPYTGLRYLSKLFRMIAIILILLLVAEVVTGFSAQGREALPTLLTEASRLVVLSALLWGVGDLALLLIDVGHDVRAARILLGRQAAHQMLGHHPDSPLGGGGEPRVDELPPPPPPRLR